MKYFHQKLVQFKYKRIVLVFSLAFLMMLVVLAINGFLPFGSKTMLINDMDIQYIEYMKGFRLSFFDFIFYNFNSGMGTSMLPMYTYYLSSPFQWFLLLFENEQLYTMITLVYACKIALSVVTMDCFLRQRYAHHKWSLLLALCYGFSAMGLVYSQSLMWLDGLYLLPLVILATEKSIQTQKVGFYGVMIALALLFNYYTGVMIALFSVLYYFMRLYQLQIKPSFTRLKNMVLSGLLAIGINMFLLLPSLLSILSNRGSANDVLYESSAVERLLGLTSVFMMEEAKTLAVEKSFIYCGLISIVLMLATFLSKHVSKKDKIAYALMLGFMGLSVVILFLYSGWHLFSMPYGFPTRFAFLISFTIVMVAAANTKLDKQSIDYSFILLMLLLGLSLIAHFSFIKLIINVIFSVLLYLILRFKQSFLIVIVAIELMFNACFTFYSLDRDNQYDGYREIDRVLTYDTNMSETLETLELADNERLESLYKKTLNDSYAWGYGSLSHYSSTYNKKVHDFLEHYGATARLFGSQYDGTTLFLDALLGVKYVLRDENDAINGSFLDNYNKIAQVGRIGIYENPYALNIAFVCDPLLEAKLPETRTILAQNDIALRLGANEDLLQSHEIDHIFAWDSELISENPYVFQNSYKSDVTSKVGIYPNFSAANEGDLGYMQLDYPNNESWYTLISNYRTRGYHYTGYDSGARYLGRINPEEEMVVELELDSNYLNFSEASFYSFDMSVFEQLIEQLKNEPEVQFIRDSDKVIMSVELQEAKDLIVTYPYDEGWKCIVDGEEVVIEEYESTFMKIPLSSGEHEIVLTYVPVGFELGLVISILSGILSISWMLLRKRKQNN